MPLHLSPSRWTRRSAQPDRPAVTFAPSPSSSIRSSAPSGKRRRWPFSSKVSPSTPRAEQSSLFVSPTPAPFLTVQAPAEGRLELEAAAVEQSLDEAGPTRPASLLSLERFLRSEWAGEREMLHFDPWVSIGVDPLFW